MARRRFLTLILTLSIPWTLMSAAQQAPPTFTMRGYPGVGAPPQIKLLTPGAEPRTALRYDIAPNRVERMDVRLSGWTSAVLRGVPPSTKFNSDLPTMNLRFDLSAGAVGSDGAIPINVTFTEYLMGGVGESVQFRAGDGVFPLRTTVTMTTRGIIESLVFDSAEPSLKRMIGQLTSPVEHLTKPLPEEAVGIGARWEVRQAIAASGPMLIRVTAFQRTEYELVAIDGTIVQLKYWVEQTAPRQKLDGPMPSDTAVDFQRMHSIGTGAITVRLNSFVPTSDFGSHTSSLVVDNSRKAGAVNGYTRTRIAPAEALAEPSKWIDRRALAGLKAVNLSGTAGSRIGPGRVCYPAPNAQAAVSAAFGGFLRAAKETLEAGGIETTPRVTDFLKIDAQVYDAPHCSAEITLELTRGFLPTQLKRILPDGQEQLSRMQNVPTWRRSFVVSGEPASFGRRVVARLTDDLRGFVADVAGASTSTGGRRLESERRTGAR